MKKGLALLLGSPKDDEEDEMDEEGDESEPQAHAEAILAAVKDDDVEALVDALKAFIKAC